MTKRKLSGMAEALLEATDDAALALSADAVWKRLQSRLDESATYLPR